MGLNKLWHGAKSFARKEQMAVVETLEMLEKAVYIYMCVCISGYWLMDC